MNSKYMQDYNPLSPKKKSRGINYSFPIVEMGHWLTFFRIGLSFKDQTPPDVTCPADQTLFAGLATVDAIIPWDRWEPVSVSFSVVILKLETRKILLNEYSKSSVTKILNSLPNSMSGVWFLSCYLSFFRCHFCYIFAWGHHPICTTYDGCLFH